MDNAVNAFTKGVHNLIDPENIPKDSAMDSSNFITKDGKIILVGGRKLIGAEGTVGKITGLWKGYKVNGDIVLYRKAGTAIQYWNGTTWIDIITGLGENDEYSFDNYSSLAGAFTFVNGLAGFWKIVNSHPTTPKQMYNSGKNFHGKILIDRGRTILWDRNDTNKKDPTGLYGSWIDRQNSTVYNTITGEAVGSSGSTVYSGMLAAITPQTTCFGVSITATVSAGTETFTDDYLGHLTSNFGGTGTIDYATMNYSVTFSSVTTGAVTATYQIENTNNKGITDFTFSATRLAGEGFQFPQDAGGDAILNVLIGQDGAYYSLKKQSAYRLSLDADDTNATNEVYRRDIGIPYWRCAVSTNKGIMFINTANPTKPEMTILTKNPIGDVIEPVVLFPHFKFGNYIFDDASMSNYDQWTMVFCKSQNAENNDTILMCNMLVGTVDIINYTGRMSIQDNGNLYIGDSLTKTIHQIFNGYDDLGLAIENYWTSKEEILHTDRLKKIRRLKFSGAIGADQYVEVYLNYDNAGFELVGTIRGSGDYVDYTNPQSIGSNFIGESQIGGDDLASAYKFYMEMKIKTPKFRNRVIKFIAKGIGYFDLNSLTDWDILLFENRIPKAYRSKQNVSIDGLSTNQ
ncbi:MAG: hypothetical protein JSS91_00785 [Bacteroidetes bacterium]|nr:hypothetical protein [Bacteroidota bacterium]